MVVRSRTRSARRSNPFTLWSSAWYEWKCTFIAYRAVQFSGRGLFDRNRTLWCGYVIQNAGRTVYFAADTAFGSYFALKC